MDKYLADLYGTGALIKTAQEEEKEKEEEKGEDKKEEEMSEEEKESAYQALVDHFTAGLTELCKNANVDPNSLTDENLAEIWGGYVEEINKQAAQAPTQNQLTKEAWAQADYMGRIMAHAYVNELANIEKKASDPGAALKDRVNQLLTGK